MHQRSRAAITCAITLAAALGSAAADGPATRPAGAADVPVRDVVLFSSGVGYFEHFGTVSGNGSTVLHFKTEQVNDILKSLVLEDMDRGQVATVTYPSQAPLARTLRSFEVDITSNPPLPDLLNQLRGARLAVSTINGPVDGTILGVEKKRRAVGDKEAVDVYVLNLRHGHTIRPISLDDIQSLEMEDAKLNEELDAALAAVAQARDQDKKPVEIAFKGEGKRRVRIGYVVETPIWKTSYRLILDAKVKPADAGPNSARLQGWAIIENQTDDDWNDVQLSLVSGRPISFIEDLYHSLYVPRPFVQPQLYASLQPQTYENGITKEEMQRIQARNANNQQQGQTGGAGGAGGGGATVTNQLFANGGQLNQAQTPQEQPIDPTASVIAAASASKLGELFQYTVPNVSIKRQQSAMIPIVTDEMDVRKVSIYNRGVLPNHPLNGARLKNSTHKHLLQGPVTVLEAGKYAGDARIDDTPPGQQRLLSYGIDLKVLVEVTDEPQQSSVQTAGIAKGVLHLTWKDVSQETYLISNRADAEKTIVIEYPRQENWKLVEPARAEEMTDSFYRFDRPVAAGKVLKIPLRQETVRAEQLQILPTDVTKLELYVKLGNIPNEVRDALNQVIEMKQTLAATQRQIDDRSKAVAAIATEQTRIRENMKTVSQSTDYYARLVKKLDEQETQIETLQKELSGFQKQLESQRKTLEERVSQFSVG